MFFQNGQEAVPGLRFGSPVVWRTLRGFVPFDPEISQWNINIVAVPCCHGRIRDFLAIICQMVWERGGDHGVNTQVMPCTSACITGVIHNKTNAVPPVCMWLWFTCEIVHSEQVLYLACLWNSSRRKRKHCMWNVPMCTCLLFRIQL